MLAKNAARIFAGGARFGAKACRPGTDLNRQPIRIESFISLQAGQLDFGRRRQPEVCVFDVKHVRGEFWQLTYAR